MLYIRENLGTLEKAKAYNKKITDYRVEAINKNYHPGCVGSRACENCFHVISDSICMCMGMPTCPNCGFTEPRLKIEIPKGRLIFDFEYENQDYSI